SHTCSVCGDYYEDNIKSKLVLSNVSGFKVSATNANAIKLVWGKVNNADGYVVYRYNTSTKKWVRIAKTGSLTFTDKNLNSGTSYKYAIRAYKTVDGKEVLSPSYPTVTTSTNPANVSGFKVSATSASAIKLAWNKTSGANGYIVYRYNTSTKKWVRIAKTASLTFTDKNLKSGTSYKYAIRAYKTVDGKDVLSPSYPTVTSSTNPATVSFKLTAGSKKVTVNWSKVTGATGYKVYYKTSANGKWIGLKTTTGTSYTKTGLTKGKTYYFTVKAYRTVGGKTYNGTFTTKSVKVK
ncbi:MAG: fibronectin type III domain-containing protein, partial [Oscillospiraceae bacterium]